MAAKHSSENEEKEGFFYTAGPALISGAAQAILFNPIDRALYVRVKFRRKHFLDRRNFERPFQGFMNAAVYRTLVGASYMFWQDSARLCIGRFMPQMFQVETSPVLNSMLIGLFAGSVNGLALNTLQAVKFRMWNSDARGVNFWQTAKHMFKEGGVPIFFRGCVTTMIRDSIFGVVYETLRRMDSWKVFFDNVVTGVSKKMPWHQTGDTDTIAPPPVERHLGAGTCEACMFVSNLVAAVLASTLSSPFNYVRSIVYGTPPGSIPLNYFQLLRSFYTQYFFVWHNGCTFSGTLVVPELAATEHRVEMSAASPRPPGTSLPPERPVGRWWKVYLDLVRWGEAHHHHPIKSWQWANSRLNIGWGSLRIGVGMAMGQSLFHLAQDFARVDKKKYLHARQES